MTNREILQQLAALVLLLIAAAGLYAYQKSPAMVPALIAYLDSPSRAEVRAAMARLGELGPAAIPAASRLLATVRAEESDADAALEALRRIDLAATLAARELVFAALRTDRTGEDANTRRRAAERLGDLGLLARPASGDLVLASRDADARVRDRAVAALGRIGLPVAVVLPALIAALDDPVDHVRHTAIAALESFPPATAQPALPVLRRLATSGSVLDQRARIALARLEAPPAAGALSSLSYMMGASHRYEARDYALHQIARHGPAAASLVPELVAVLASDTDPVRYAVIETLAAIGPAAGVARPALERIAAGSPPLREVAREALAAIGKVPQ